MQNLMKRIGKGNKMEENKVVETKMLYRDADIHPEILRAVEEMGFEPDMSTAELIMSYSRKDSFTDVYLIKTDVEIDALVLQPEEVAEARWMTRSDFDKLLEESKK